MEILLFLIAVFVGLSIIRGVLRFGKSNYTMELAGYLTMLEIPEDFLNEVASDELSKKAVSLARKFLENEYPIFRGLPVVKKDAAAIYLLWDDEQTSLGWHNHPRYENLVSHSERIIWAEDDDRVAGIVAAFAAKNVERLKTLAALEE